MTQSLLVIALLIAASAFFSMAEISLAAARRLRLRQMADEGDPRADLVLRIQEQPGDYFTVVQVGQNAVAILGGIVGEGALSPHFSSFFSVWMSDASANTAGFIASFLIFTSLFILFADLFPKRLGMAEPERLAVRLARPMAWSWRCCALWCGSTAGGPMLCFGCWACRRCATIASHQTTSWP